MDDARRHGAAPAVLQGVRYTVEAFRVMTQDAAVETLVGQQRELENTEQRLVHAAAGLQLREQRLTETEARATECRDELRQATVIARHRVAAEQDELRRAVGAARAEFASEQADLQTAYRTLENQYSTAEEALAASWAEARGAGEQAAQRAAAALANAAAETAAADLARDHGQRQAARADALHAALARAEGAAEAAQGRADSADTEAAAYRLAHEQEQRQAARARALQVALARAEGASEAAHGRADASEAELAAANHQVQGALRNARAARADAEESVSTLEAELRHAEAQTTELQKQLEDERVDHDMLIGEYRELEQQYFEVAEERGDEPPEEADGRPQPGGAQRFNIGTPPGAAAASWGAAANDSDSAQRRRCRPDRGRG